MVNATDGGVSSAEAAESHGVEFMVAMTIGLLVTWTALFYLFVWLHPWAARHWPKSSKRHEETKYWFAWYAVGTLHALLVAALTVPAFIMLATAPGSAQFVSTNDVFCTGSEGDDEWLRVEIAIVVGGICFTTYTFVDMVLALKHGLAAADYVVHHLAFLACGVLIWGQCIMPFNASVLMCMEATTPFLNFLMFFRNRGARYKTSTTICGAVFVVLFFVFRIGLNTYGTVVLWVSREDPALDTVPRWQVWLLLFAVTLGLAVQVFWLPKVAGTFCKAILGMVRGDTGSDDEDGDEEEDEEDEEDEDTDKENGHEHSVGLVSRELRN